MYDNIQHVLTVSTNLFVLSFILLMVFDFVAGLQQLYSASVQQTGTATIPTSLGDSPSPILTSHAIATLPTPHSSASTPQPLPQSAFALPDPWFLPVQDRSPTSPHQAQILAKPLLLLPPAQPQSDYAHLSIRQLKKLASASKLKYYNTMTKSQLIAALTA